MHCKRIEPLIIDSSKFKTRKIHVNLKYRYDAFLFHNLGVGRWVDVGSSVWINPDFTKEKRNARYVLRHQRQISFSIAKGIQEFPFVQMHRLSQK